MLTLTTERLFNSSQQVCTNISTGNAVVLLLFTCHCFGKDNRKTKEMKPVNQQQRFLNTLRWCQICQNMSTSSYKETCFFFSDTSIKLRFCKWVVSCLTGSYWPCKDEHETWIFKYPFLLILFWGWAGHVRRYNITAWSVACVFSAYLVYNLLLKI